MKIFLIQSVTAFFLLVSQNQSWALTGARSADDWNPADIIPTGILIGSASQEEESRLIQARKDLVQLVQFIKDAGLPQPQPLKQFVYFPTLEIPIQDLFHKMYATAEFDPIADIKKQRETLMNSEFALVAKKNPGLAQKILAQLGIEKGDDPIEFLFDFYLGLRYGFSFKNIWTQISQNKKLSEIVEFARGPIADNAYFTQLFRFELSAILPAPIAKPTSVKDVINFDALNALSPNAVVRQIVILPRSTEHENDDISTLLDRSVYFHEFGHHVNNTQKGNGHFPRMLDEEHADALAVAALKDPLIGHLFAVASGKVGDRILNSGKPISDGLRRFAMAMKHYGEQGFLRDMSAKGTLSQLHALPEAPDPYTSGNPYRYVTWNLMQLIGDNLKTYGLLAQAVVEYAKLPATDDESDFRNTPWKDVTQASKHQLLRWIDQIDWHLQRNRKASSEEVELRRAKNLLSTYFENGGVEILVGNQKKDQNGANSSKIPADTILPQIFRIIHQLVQERFPELEQKYLDLVQQVTDGTVQPVRLSSSQRTFVLLSNPSVWTDETTKSQIDQLMRKIEDLKVKIANEGDHLNRNSPMVKQYIQAMTTLHELERPTQTTKLGTLSAFLKRADHQVTQWRIQRTLSACALEFSP